MKSISSSHYMEIQKIHSWQCTPSGLINHSEKVKGWLPSISIVAQHFTECFKQNDSMLNTSVITAVTKPSMKPQSGATANRHLHGSEERNGGQRIVKVRFCRTMMCEHWNCSSLQNGTSRDETTLNSEEIKPIALAVIKLHASVR